jgi:hypothetical protein
VSRHELVTYRCGWCAVEAPAEAGPGIDLFPPKTWRYLDSLDFDDDLCGDCATAATSLLAGIRAARRAGVPCSTEDRKEKP